MAYFPVCLAYSENKLYLFKLNIDLKLSES